MIKLKDILEAAVHPDALHVSPVKVEGKTKYQVKAVGKNFSDGIKVGEHLTDTHLDDASEMGAKIKHVKEEVEQVEEASKAYNDASALHDKLKAQNRAAAAKASTQDDEPKTFVQKVKKDIGTPLKHLMKGNLKKAITENVLEEGAEAHAQFQQYHNDSAKLLKGIGGALSKHYDNVTNKKGWNGGEANWNHVAEVKGAHRALQDLHDAILQTGEWHKPVDAKKLKEEVEPEADMNILVQLRKPIDILEHGTQGGADITFGDGQKVFVEGTVAQKLVESMEKIKPEDRVKVAEFLYQSHDNMMAVYARLK